MIRQEEIVSWLSRNGFFYKRDAERKNIMIFLKDGHFIGLRYEKNNLASFKNNRVYACATKNPHGNVNLISEIGGDKSNNDGYIIELKQKKDLTYDGYMSLHKMDFQGSFSGELYVCIFELNEENRPINGSAISVHIKHQINNEKHIKKDSLDEAAPPIEINNTSSVKSEVIEIKNKEAISLLQGGSHTVDMHQLGYKIQSAANSGNKAVKVLLSHEEDNFFERLWYDDEIKKHTIRAIKSVKDMTESSVILSAINLDNSIEIKRTQKLIAEERVKSHDNFRNFSAYIREKSESISSRMDKIEKSAQILGSTDLEVTLLDINSSIKEIQDKLDGEVMERNELIGRVNNKIEYLTKIADVNEKKRSKDISNIKNTIYVFSAIIFIFLLSIASAGIFIVSKKIMAYPASAECIESSVCLIKWLIGL